MKYLRSTTLGRENIGIKRSESVTKTQVQKSRCQFINYKKSKIMYKSSDKSHDYWDTLYMKINYRIIYWDTLYRNIDYRIMYWDTLYINISYI